MTDLLAQTPRQFIEIALKLSSDLDALSSLRASLRQRMRASPLCDERTFARDVEAAYRWMWEQTCGAPIA